MSYVIEVGDEFNDVCIQVTTREGDVINFDWDEAQTALKDEVKTLVTTYKDLGESVSARKLTRLIFSFASATDYLPPKLEAVANSIDRINDYFAEGLIPPQACNEDRIIRPEIIDVLKHIGFTEECKLLSDISEQASKTLMYKLDKPMFKKIFPKI